MNNNSLYPIEIYLDSICLISKTPISELFPNVTFRVEEKIHNDFEPSQVFSTEKSNTYFCKETGWELGTVSDHLWQLDTLRLTDHGKQLFFDLATVVLLENIKKEYKS